MSRDVEAYCPECKEELTREEYNYDSGCNECGCEEIFLGPEAFAEFAQSEW